MQHTYFVQYSWEGKTYEWHRLATSPIIALNKFHRWIQRNKEVSALRKTLRPKLKPNEYRVLRLFLKYEDSAKKEVTSDFDLPNSPNPDVRTTRPKKTPEPAFEFLKEVPVRE